MTSTEKFPIGHFRILDIDGLDEHAATLVNGGIETRYKEHYYFDNMKRPAYGGYLFQYTLNGKGIYEKHGVCHEMQKGMGFFVKLPEDSRYYLPKEFDVPWTFYYLHFTGDILTPYADKLISLTDSVVSLDLSTKTIVMLLKLQERLCNGGKIKKYEGTEIIFSFFCTLLRDIENKDTTKNSPLIKQAVEIMNDEYSDLESISYLAKKLNVTSEYFCRLFKHELGMSPGQYLTDLRIQSAMYDLLNTDENLEKIAQKNGFSNANYFGKSFKKRVGKTPLQYRNME